MYTLVIMSNTTVLNVKIDKDLKKAAQDTAKALGLPVSTLVAASLKEIVRTRSITITDEPRLKPEVEAELLRLSQAFKNGESDEFVGPFETIDDFFADLDS